MANLKWYGAKVVRNIEKASRIGINMTMGAGVAYAKNNHPFTNRSTTAEKSIAITAPAIRSGSQVFGLWGSKNVNYFKLLEVRAPARGMTRGKVRHGKGAPPWKGGRPAPTLGPAASEVYPQLARNIRKVYKRLRKK